MAKRFTDTEKWKRPWFSELPNLAKLAWVYIIDDCDYRGVWVANFKRMSFDLGSRVTEKKFQEWFGAKSVRLDDDKYFIPSFVEFQYGKEEDLSPNNKVHKGVLEILSVAKAIESGVTQAPSMPLGEIPSPLGKRQGVQDKDKDKDTEKDKDRADSFEIVWKLYPRRIDKAEARDRFDRLIKTDRDLEELIAAIHNYRAECKRKQTEEAYIKHLATFLGTEKKPRWREWVRPEPSEDFSNPQDLVEQQRREQIAREEAERRRKQDEIDSLPPPDPERVREMIGGLFKNVGGV